MATATLPAVGEHAAGARRGLAARLERHRPELTCYCRGMLGSAFDADDAVQETLVRAWRAFERFEGRSTLRSWLYRIARNVCLDMLRRSRRLPEPVDPTTSNDGACISWEADPAERAASRDTVRSAVLAMLLHLPPRQRAVLILREVLRWRASEVAELLGTTEAAVNSVLQRARGTIAAGPGTSTGRLSATGLPEPGLLARYVDAFDRHDLDSLMSLVGVWR